MQHPRVKPKTSLPSCLASFLSGPEGLGSALRSPRSSGDGAVVEQLWPSARSGSYWDFVASGPRRFPVGGGGHVT